MESAYKSGSLGWLLEMHVSSITRELVSILVDCLEADRPEIARLESVLNNHLDHLRLELAETNELLRELVSGQHTLPDRQAMELTGKPRLAGPKGRLP